MAENIASRVVGVLRGSAHVVMDKIEDKAGAAVLKNHIREVETALDAVSLELGQERSRIHHVYKQERSLLSRIQTLDASIRHALQGGRRNLAQVGISEKLGFEQKLADAQKTLEEMRENEQTLAGYEKQLKAKLSEMTAAYEDWLRVQGNREGEAGGIIGMVGGLSGAPQALSAAQKSADKFEARFKRDMGVGLEGGLGGNEAALEEMEQMRHQNQVAGELARYEAELALAGGRAGVDGEGV